MTRAPAKLNLGLYLGPRRQDGLHELRSLFAPLTIADRIVISPWDRDEVVCPAVEGPNLAGQALAALRARGWTGPPVRIEIDKRIPVAAGLGGGSADAAAVLRHAAGAVDGLAEIAASLGADVPSQLDPAFSLVGGAGEQVERLPDPSEYALVLIPSDRGLATHDVYAEAERLGLARPLDELDALEGRLRDAAVSGASPLEYADLLVNDLAEAALSLRPEIGDALEALRAVGASAFGITGSGPTAFGLFGDLPHADRAASSLPARFAAAIVTGPDRFRPRMTAAS